MSSQLEQALICVDRLNSWVRSGSFRESWSGSSLRRHIYELKRRAIVEADTRLACTHRPLSLLVTCRDCRGTGKYEDWNGYVHPHCWACASSGVARLHFVESRIGEVRWHSPLHAFPLPSERLGGETSAGDWTVNAAGNDLALEDAAECLLLADEAFPGKLWQRECRCGSMDSCPLHYGLYIGRSVAQCAHCGWEPKENCGGRVGRVSFTFAVCEQCRQARDTDALFAVGLPEELLTPNVAEWIRRNDALISRRGGAQ